MISLAESHRPHSRSGHGRPASFIQRERQPGRKREDKSEKTKSQRPVLELQWPDTGEISAALSTCQLSHSDQIWILEGESRSLNSSAIDLILSWGSGIPW